MEDDSTIITIEEEPRRLTKNEVLQDARVKALESRRRTQKLKLENKLQEVRILLGELRPEYIEKVIQVLSDRETHIQNRHASILTEINDCLQSEATKREQESASIKRRLDTVIEEVRFLREAITKKRSEAPSLSSSVQPVQRKR